MSDLKVLARQYAAENPQWAKPGMACRDDGAGATWRRGWQHWHGVACGGVTSVLLDDEPGYHARVSAQSLARAIAAGPDTEDAATMGAILLGLPARVATETLKQCRWSRDVSMAGTHNMPAAGHADLQGHILRAAIAMGKA